MHIRSPLALLRPWFRWVFLVLALAVGPAVSAAQSGFGGFGARQYASSELFARVDGDLVRVAVQVAIEEGWHLYHDDLGPEDAVGKPTELLFDGPGAAFGPVRFPTPKRYEQPGLGTDGKDTWIYAHGGAITLYALGRITDPQAFDLGSLTVDIQGLTCAESGSCVPYNELLEVAGDGPDGLFAAFPSDLGGPETLVPRNGNGGGASEAAAGALRDADWSKYQFNDYTPKDGAGGVQRGLLMWLLLAFVAGAILNVMPCVLPVISIKVLSFVQQAGEDRRRILHLGLAFAAGILVVFLALAAVVISAGLSWGEQFQSEWFLVAMIGIVFAFALSLFGVYELGVPAKVGELAGVRREGLADAFFKGMLATLLATPCSGPFLGSTLTWTLAQPALVIFLVFAFLGLGMAVPYVILTAQPALLKRLPKPGPWMDVFKQAMGFVLLATIVYLMVSLPQHLMLFTVTFLVFVALGCWWYGRFATFERTALQRFAHLAVGLVIAGGGAQLSFGNFQRMFTHESSGWQVYDPEALEQFLAEGRPVFVDFTANWCPNCKVNERFVFDHESVRRVMETKGVVAMKADITYNNDYTEMVDRKMRALGARSIPFLAVFDPRDPKAPVVRRDLVTRGEMIEIFSGL